MDRYYKSKKLSNVCYDIRGPVLQRANELEEEGYRILKLNIGNPAPFGFNAPDEIIQDVIRMLPESEGYSDSKGLYSARKAVMQECQKIGIPNVEVGDIYLGNGASELITMATQALLNIGDEVLIPAPDYPLWTAVVSLSGAKPVHYLCDEDNGWQPSVEDIESKITANTRAIVIINPNNPTGAVYSREMLEQLVAIAEKYKLVIFADEIYSKILYDDAVHIPLGSISQNVLCLTFNGLSKAYRLAGFRSGWLIVSGAKDEAKDYIEGLNILSSMRLCANVPAQHAIQTALGGYQSINELILPGGRLLEQRDIAYRMLNDIPGVSCTKPEGAIYMFPRLDPAVYPVVNDEQLVLDLLNQERILLVQGRGFNWHKPDHLRIVFLPNKVDLTDALNRFANFLDGYRKVLTRRASAAS
ncbi:pyridoxal phosphate-dependent aminotransferase [Spongiibacter taiwanensis]|uniref:pyridoxal phosphate-dependent aminotransferase n=1 Tax=Spongiibacter taiwanensis TaxID=1748242 RepID=UPI002035781E|nr:pyridoxal phosphate-dependent aminotransferase [Spongiibacter taiwanensis]USA43299.1 pyridoxal phosphate-dependent aminotransferase [Spongiibacter taiwanensis]